MRLCPRGNGSAGDFAHPTGLRRVTRAPTRKPTVGTALRLTYRAFARDLARRLAPHGVTLLMWFVLRELWKRDGLSQAEIAGAADRQASAIVSVVRSPRRPAWCR